MMNYVVAIVGPTGIGKTRLAIDLAREFNAEIVNADSRQVYRHMDIGTAKPTPTELTLVPHHLINIVNPDEEFSLAQFQKLARQAIKDIEQRNKLVLLVGGSGQYIWSIIEGWGIPEVPPDLEYRRKLEERAISSEGQRELYKELVKIDPAAAANIDPQNIRRVIRALEVYARTEKPFSQLQRKKSPSFNTTIIGLTIDRAELYRRIDQRVDKMIEQGLVKEVRKLMDMGYGFNLPSMSSIGYRQIGMFLKNELSMEVAIQQIKFETHRLVRQQYNWFRLKDDRIIWFDIQNNIIPEVNFILASTSILKKDRETKG